MKYLITHEDIKAYDDTLELAISPAQAIMEILLKKGAPVEGVGIKSIPFHKYEVYTHEEIEGYIFEFIPLTKEDSATDGESYT